MTPGDLDLAAALRQVLRHPLVRDELKAIVAEVGPVVDVQQVEGYIGPAEAARRAGVKPAAVRAWIAKGLLSAGKPPGTRDWRIKPADLEALLSERTGVAPVPIDLERKRVARVDALAAAAKRGRGQ